MSPIQRSPNLVASSGFPLPFSTIKIVVTPTPNMLPFPNPFQWCFLDFSISPAGRHILALFGVLPNGECFRASPFPLLTSKTGEELDTKLSETWKAFLFAMWNDETAYVTSQNDVQLLKYQNHFIDCHQIRKAREIFRFADLQIGDTFAGIKTWGTYMVKESANRAIATDGSSQLLAVPNDMVCVLVEREAPISEPSRLDQPVPSGLNQPLQAPNGLDQMAPNVLISGTSDPVLYLSPLAAIKSALPNGYYYSADFGSLCRSTMMEMTSSSDSSEFFDQMAELADKVDIVLCSVTPPNEVTKYFAIKKEE